MSFPQLEQLKRESPLHSQVSRLESILEEYLRRPPQDILRFFRSPSHVIHPISIAVALDVPVERAFTLLELFEDVGILTREYEVRCPDNGELIERFHKLEDVPHNIECFHHNGIEAHSIADYKFAIVYGFTHSVVEDRLLTVA